MIKRRFYFSVLRARQNAPETRRAFTLLEILLVLALMAVVLGGLAATIKLFSNNYAANERRVGRAQLARSISQMLSDDLGAAIQDPIQNVGDDPERQFIRHFGLRGDERSLQIDVVQPNLFSTTATAEENKRVSEGADKSLASKQAPELKTIFYEFVPINSAEVAEGESREDSATTQSEFSSSQLGGSLTSVDGDAALRLEDSSESLDAFLDVTRPLVQKFGLSRRELDYETPEENEDSESNNSTTDGTSFDPETGEPVSTMTGSLTSLPDSSSSTLASGVDASSSPFDNNAYNANLYKEPLTAAQIAMDSDDGTTWAPEVLDCRFSYFDGKDWLTSWDSIEKNGLPIAIKVELKLSPLDDVDLYRSSPLLYNLPVPPDLSAIAKLTSEKENEASDGVNTSRLTGSLTKTVEETKPGNAVDVFNSYRPLSSIRAALLGESLPTASSAPAFAEATASVSNGELGDESEGEGTNVELGGSLSNDLTQSENSFGGSLTTDDATLSGSDVNSLALIAQTYASRGVVYNEAGVCVDFANLGNYTTLEQMAREIGVAEPIVYEVVAYLPTTPYSRAKTLERRKPTVVRVGTVATGRTRNASSRERRASGANPYATGRARQYQERRVNERTATNRTPRDRQRNERGATSRQRQERNVANRNSEDAVRMTSDRGTQNRSSRTRTVASRQARERSGVNGGQIDSESDVSLADALNAEGGVWGTEASDSSVGLESPNVSTLGGVSPLGGAAGSPLNNSTPINEFDPFEIVNSSTNDVAFASADSEFAAVDSSSEGLTIGVIETPNGDANVVSSQRSTPKASNKQQQTWIRGKK